jgi:hypothetical protein
MDWIAWHRERQVSGEYGMILPQAISHIAKRVPAILEDGENTLPGSSGALLCRLGEYLEELDRQVDELEAQMRRWTCPAPARGTAPISALDSGCFEIGSTRNDRCQRSTHIADPNNRGSSRRR